MVCRNCTDKEGSWDWVTSLITARTPPGFCSSGNMLWAFLLCRKGSVFSISFLSFFFHFLHFIMSCMSPKKCNLFIRLHIKCILYLNQISCDKKNHVRAVGLKIKERQAENYRCDTEPVVCCWAWADGSDMITAWRWRNHLSLWLLIIENSDSESLTQHMQQRWSLLSFSPQCLQQISIHNCCIWTFTVSYFKCFCNRIKMHMVHVLFKPPLMMLNVKTHF